MKVVKILAAVAASIIGLLIIAAVLIAWLFDPNDYKDYLTNLFEQRTGRSLAVEDDLELSFFPWLAIETGGITIGNAPGFEQRPFATIDRVSARVRLVPLLKRELDIGTIRLDGLTLELAMDASGRGNWADLQERAVPAEPSADTGVTSAELAKFDVEGIVLRGARVLWRSSDDEPVYVVSELNLETGSINAIEPTDVNLEFALLDVASQLAAQIDMSSSVALGASGAVTVSGVNAEIELTDGRQRQRAQSRLELAELAYSPDGAFAAGRGKVSGSLVDPPYGPARLPFEVVWDRATLDTTNFGLVVDGLDTQVAGIDAAWQLSAASLLDAPVLNGSLRISGGSVASLLDLVSMEPPAGSTAAGLGNFNLTTGFSVDVGASSASLSNVNVDLLGANLRAANASIGTNRLEGAVAIAPFRPGDALRAILAANLPEDVDVAAIQRLSFDGNVSADLGTGNTSLSNIRAELLGASVSGTLNVSQQADGGVYTGSLSSNRFEPDELLDVLDALVTDRVDAGELGMLAVTSDFAYNQGRNELIMRSLRLEAFGLSATGQLEARNLTASPSFSGQARIADFAPRALLRRFELAPPQSSDPNVLRSASVQGSFDITSQSGRFDDLMIALDDTRISGNFTVEDFANPAYRFDLSADRLDVDRYLPPQTNVGEQSDGNERRAGDIEISKEPLTTLAINGKVAVGALHLAGMDYQNVATNISVGGGRLLLDSAHANLYGGEFAGSFRVDTTEDQPSMSLVGHAERLQLEPLITALTGSANFRGTGNFDIDLTGHGPTVTDNLRSAAGTMGFALRDGSIDGFNVEQKLCGYYNYLRQLPAPPARPKRTAYDLIQGTATVQDGIASSNDLSATAPTIAVRGNGRLSLVEQIADYSFDAQVSKSIAIPNCESMDRLVGIDFPLTLKGPVTDPDVQPDYTEIIKRYARQEAEDRVREKLQDRLKDILR